MHPPVLVEIQGAGGADDLVHWPGARLEQPADQVVCVVTHRMQPRQSFLGRPELAVKARKIGDPSGRIDDPRRLREHYLVQVRVGATVHGINERGRVDGQFAGVMKFELRLDQPAGLGIGGEEDKIDVLTAPRIELQRASDVCAQALISLHTLRKRHQFLNLEGKVLHRRFIAAVIDQLSAGALEFTGKTRQHATSPVGIGHEGDTAGQPVVDCPRCGGPGFILGCQRELVEAGWGEGIVRQVVERKHRDGQQRLVGQGDNVRPLQRSDDEFGALADRRLVGGDRTAALVDVVDAYLLRFGQPGRGTEVGAQEAVPDCITGRGAVPRQGQQEGYLARKRQRPAFRQVHLLEDADGRMIAVGLAPLHDAVAPANALLAGRIR